MAEFIEREVLTVKDYDLYCHYVAGLVGIGLSRVGMLSTRLHLIFTGGSTACINSLEHACSSLRQVASNLQKLEVWRTCQMAWASSCRRQTSFVITWKTLWRSLLQGLPIVYKVSFHNIHMCRACQSWSILVS